MKNRMPQVKEKRIEENEESFTPITEERTNRAPLWKTLLGIWFLMMIIVNLGTINTDSLKKEDCKSVFNYLFLNFNCMEKMTTFDPDTEICLEWKYKYEICNYNLPLFCITDDCYCNIQYFTERIEDATWENNTWNNRFIGMGAEVKYLGEECVDWRRKTHCELNPSDEEKCICEEKSKKVVSTDYRRGVRSYFSLESFNDSDILECDDVIVGWKNNVDFYDYISKEGLVRLLSERDDVVLEIECRGYRYEITEETCNKIREKNECEKGNPNWVWDCISNDICPLCVHTSSPSEEIYPNCCHEENTIEDCWEKICREKTDMEKLREKLEKYDCEKMAVDMTTNCWDCDSNYYDDEDDELERFYVLKGCEI